MGFKTFVVIGLIAIGCCLVLTEAYDPWYGYDHPSWYHRYASDHPDYNPCSISAYADSGSAKTSRMVKKVWAPWTYASPETGGRFHSG